ADAVAGLPVASAVANAAGGATLTLPGVDLAEVFVQQTDLAENVSPRRRVRDVRWTATMGGKVAGSAFANPHRFESRSMLARHLQQGSVIELGDEAAVADGDSVVTSG